MARFALTGETSLYVLLPASNTVADLQQVEERMTDTALLRMINNMKTIVPQKVDVILPKIKLDVEPDMFMLVKKLGLLLSPRLLTDFDQIHWHMLLYHLVPSYQGCRHSLRMPICVAFTLKIGWFWMMSDTEVSWRWLSKGSRPWLSPLLHSLARTIRFRPCSLLSSCCGVTRSMCPSLLVEWLTRDARKVRVGDRLRETKEELKQKCTF